MKELYLFGFGAIVVIVIIIMLLHYASRVTPDQRDRLKNALPDGCEVIEVGAYGTIDNLIIINCERHRVQSSIMYSRKPAGKSSRVEFDAIYLITAG